MEIHLIPNSSTSTSYHQFSEHENGNRHHVIIETIEFVFDKSRELDLFNKDFKENVSEMFDFSRWTNQKLNYKYMVLEYLSDRLRYLSNPDSKKTFNHRMEIESCCHLFRYGRMKDFKEFVTEKQSLTHPDFFDNYINKNYFPQSLKPYIEKVKDKETSGEFSKNKYQFLNIHNKDSLVGMVIPQPIVENNFIFKFMNFPLTVEIKDALAFTKFIAPELHQCFSDVVKYQKYMESFTAKGVEAITPFVAEDDLEEKNWSYISCDVSDKPLDYFSHFADTLDTVIKEKPEWVVEEAPLKIKTVANTKIKTAKP